MMSTAGRRIEFISNEGVFNIEGGSYPKVSGLDAHIQPELANAIQFGSVLENIKFYDDIHREVDFNDTSITTNIRACFPLENLPNAKIPAVGGHPKNIIFLTLDSNGVLPPVSRLSDQQALYHFISGYTTQIGGMTDGDPKSHTTFSECFNEGFILRDPCFMTSLLEKKLKENGTKVWLVNTGWIRGDISQGKVGYMLTSAHSIKIH